MTTSYYIMAGINAVCCLDIIESTIAMNDKLQTSSTTHNNCQEWLDAHHCLEGEVVCLEDEMEGLVKEVLERTIL